MFPAWAHGLFSLYWCLRAARHFSRPSPRTLQRQILAEKKRLISEGVDPFELHAVCVLLRRPEHCLAAKRAAALLIRRGY